MEFNNLQCAERINHREYYFEIFPGISFPLLAYPFRYLVFKYQDKMILFY